MIFIPFLILAINFSVINLFGLTIIFILMRAYSAYLFKAPKNIDTFIYIFFIPEIITGPFRPYTHWSKINFNGFFNKLNLFKIIDHLIIILFVGIFFSYLYSYTNSKIIKSLLIYLTLYYQFRSASEIANCLSISLGQSYVKNFNSPLLATSITDFWNRWHISLGYFAKTHVNQLITIYLAKTGINIKLSYFISVIYTFVFIGLWHNISYSYLFFGFYFGIIIFLERIFASTVDKIFSNFKFKDVIGIIYTQTAHLISLFIVSEYIYKILIVP